MNLKEQGVDLEVTEKGDGPPVLVLPGVFNLENRGQELEALAEDHTVITFTHPGFSPVARPAWCDSVDDLKFLYDDWIVERGLQDVTLLGCSFGGWVALTMAVEKPAWLSRLVLVDSFGFRVGEREERVIADLFAMTLGQIRELAFVDQGVAERYLGSEGRSPEELVEIVRFQEGAAVYGWKPYMHDPKLGGRLERIDAPTLVVWGSQDGVIGVAQGDALAAAIPGAELVVIEGAGHAPHIEHPEKFSQLLSDFIEASSDTKNGDKRG